MCNRISLAMIFLVPLGWAASSFAQPQVPAQANPRPRGPWRDQAILYGRGPEVREFVESRGDCAARAVRACSPGIARQLARFHKSGLLDELPRPDGLLYAIELYGDDVCLFMLDNADRLRDVDTCDAFLTSPLDYTVSLKSLAAGAAEIHAMRLRQSSYIGLRTLVLIVGAAGVVCLFVWRRRMFL